MAGRARIYAVEALKAFRPALVKFAEETSSILAGADNDIAAAAIRLRTERLPYWGAEIRRRREELVRAKAKLSMKQYAPEGESRSTVDERKAVERAQRAVQEAEEKEAATRRWIRELERAQATFAGALGGLRSAVCADIPRAIGEIDRMNAALEAYIRLAPSKAGPLDRQGEDEGAGASDGAGTRGGFGAGPGDGEGGGVS